MQKNGSKLSHKKITQSRKDAKGKIINDFFIFAVLFKFNYIITIN